MFDLNIAKLARSLGGVKISLALLKKAISYEVGFTVDAYEMLCLFKKRTISFTINVDGVTRVYPYVEPDKLYVVLDDLVKAELNTDDTIDILVVKHNKDDIEIILAYHDVNGIPQKITKPL